MLGELGTFIACVFSSPCGGGVEAQVCQPEYVVMDHHEWLKFTS